MHTLKTIPFFSVLHTRKQVGALQRFDETKLRLLGQLFTYVKFGRHEVLMREGELGLAFWITDAVWHIVRISWSWTLLECFDVILDSITIASSIQRDCMSVLL